MRRRNSMPATVEASPPRGSPEAPFGPSCCSSKLRTLLSPPVKKRSFTGMSSLPRVGTMNPVSSRSPEDETRPERQKVLHGRRAAQEILRAADPLVGDLDAQARSASPATGRRCCRAGRSSTLALMLAVV